MLLKSRQGIAALQRTGAFPCWGVGTKEAFAAGGMFLSFNSWLVTLKGTLSMYIAKGISLHSGWSFGP